MPSRAISHRLTRGFTLIELLVVVAIIGLLMSIMLPALSKAKNTAQRTVCASNIRSLLQATQVYLNEFNNTFPLNGLVLPKDGPYGNGVSDEQKWRLEYGALWPYVNRQSKVYMCPADDGSRTNTTTAKGYGPLNLIPSAPTGPTTLPCGDITTLSGTVVIGPGGKGYWSYSVNAVTNSEGRFRASFPSGKPWTDPLKATEIRSPTSFIIFVEEDFASLFNDEVFEPPAYSRGDMLSGRHNGKTGNVGFADSHVEYFSQVSFNLGAGADPNANVDHYTAMQKPFTSMFFPDGGEFATVSAPTTGP